VSELTSTGRAARSHPGGCERKGASCSHPSFEGEQDNCDRLGRPGSDLLSRVLRHSTIGAGELNDRVRNGIGWGISARTTRSAKPSAIYNNSNRLNISLAFSRRYLSRSKENSERHVRRHTWVWRVYQAYRAISTGKLRSSRTFHTRPIDVIVYHGSQGNLVLRWVSRLDAFSGYPDHT
jgi:hypothetical protein